MNFIKRKGATLIFTLILFAVLATLSVAIINIAFSTFQNFETKSNRFQSKLVARSGLDLASQYIIDDNEHFKATLGSNDEMNIYYVFNSQNSNNATLLPSHVVSLLPSEEYVVRNKVVSLRPAVVTTSSTDLDFSGANGVAIVSIKPDRSHKDEGISEIRYTIKSEGFVDSKSSEISLILLEDNTVMFAEEIGARLFEAGHILKKVTFDFNDNLDPKGNEGYSLPATSYGTNNYIQNVLGIPSVMTPENGSTFQYINKYFPNFLNNATKYELNEGKDLIAVFNNGNYTLSTEENVFDFTEELVDGNSEVVLDRSLAIVFEGTLNIEGHFPPNVKLILIGAGNSAKVVINDKTGNDNFNLNAHIIASNVFFGTAATFDPTTPNGFPTSFTGAILTANTNVKPVNTNFSFSDPYYFFNMMYAKDSNNILKIATFEFPLSRSNEFFAALTPTSRQKTFTKNEYSD